ncbi:hypothetical protein B296_00011828, partial [Ensete ventricosum]
SVASSNSRKVQNLIERCLQLYMNRGEVVRTLSSRARIEPGFTTLGGAVNLPMGYPVLPQHPMPATFQPHVDPMGCGLSSCHVVNGIPAPGSFHPIRLNSGTKYVSCITYQIVVVMQHRIVKLTINISNCKRQTLFVGLCSNRNTTEMRTPQSHNHVRSSVILHKNRLILDF